MEKTTRGRGQVMRVNDRLTRPQASDKISFNILLQVIGQKAHTIEERATRLQSLVNLCRLRGVEYYWHASSLSPGDERQSLYLIVADASTAEWVRKQCIGRRYFLHVHTVHDVPPSVLEQREGAHRSC